MFFFNFHLKHKQYFWFFMLNIKIYKIIYMNGDTTKYIQNNTLYVLSKPNSNKNENCFCINC